MRPIIRIQLSIIALVAVVSLTVMTFSYLEVQKSLGIGTMTVIAEVPVGGGLYPRSNVAYRGATVGTVESLSLGDRGVRAQLRIDDSLRIPRDGLQVNVHSMSAIGEQYIDLVPTTQDGPVLSDGDDLPLSAATVPVQTGPLLDQANELLASIPQDKLRTLINTAFTTFRGSEDDLARIVDSTRAVTSEAVRNKESTDELIRKLGPLLQTQADTADSIATWSRQLETFTSVVAQQDSHLRSIIDQAPGTASQVQGLIEDLSPTIPVLLRNLISLGQVTLTYRPGVEQILVLMPPLIAALQTMVKQGAPDGAATADFHVMSGPICTTGYAPPDQRRDAGELTVIDTPPGQFCSIPQDSPVAVRGARNLPCMEFPGRRAPTPEACRDGYVPKGPLPSSIDGTGQPGHQGLADALAPAAYSPDSGTYAAPDGGVYHHTTLAPEQGGELEWQHLWTAQQ